MGVAASSLLQECERFFQQAEALVPGSLTLSLSECRDFLTQAASLLRAPEEADLFTASESFLAVAQRLLKPDQLPLLDECQAFLTQAEKLFLEHWRRRIDLLREADPRNRPGFQAVNLLEVFGISRQEAPHSRFLGWLLDPRGSHGLGTVFLDSFLQLVQRTHGFEFEADLRDAKVELERGTDRGVPDVTIIGSNFLCVVENKLLAVEGRDQTRRYADAAEEEACQRGIPSAHLLLVFLSPSGRRPKDSRFHALAYPPLLQLLENILDRDTLPLAEVAIRQFVFNLRARVLHEYDHSTAALTHLAGYAEQGGQYLRGHWPEIGNLIEALREVNNMSGFERFSDVSLLYAENYDLVRAMTKAFEDDRKQLFVDLQNRIAEAPWFDSMRTTLHPGPSSVTVRLRVPKLEKNIARISIYLDASRLGRREFYSDLKLVAEVPDIQLFKTHFEEAAAQLLLEALRVEDYKRPRVTEYLICRDVPFEPNTSVDVMLEEVERLQQFFPYVEQVYLDLVQGEQEV